MNWVAFAARLGILRSATATDEELAAASLPGRDLVRFTLTSTVSVSGEFTTISLVSTLAKPLPETFR